MNTQQTSSHVAVVTNRSRRNLLGFAAAAAAGVMAGLQPSWIQASPTVADESGVSPELEGAWLDTVTFVDPCRLPLISPYLHSLPTLEVAA